VTEPPVLPPLHALTWHAYEAVVANRPVLVWLANTVIVTLGTVVLALAVAVPAGWSLSRFGTRGKQSAGFILLASRMLPPTLIVIPFFVIAGITGMIDSLFSLVLANAAVGVPFAVWLLKSFFDGIPRELEQAAMIDGCSEIGALLRVTVHLARPGIAASAVYTGIVAWGDFVFARTLVLHPDKWVITVGLTSFIGEHGVDWTQLMAAGSLSLLPALLLFLLLEPFLVSGMTQGAVTN
jgi:multiple sugar transport system permease protein